MFSFSERRIDLRSAENSEQSERKGREKFDETRRIRTGKKKKKLDSKKFSSFKTSKSTISKALIYHANLNENSLLPSNQMLLNQYRKSENSSTSLIENLSVPTPSGQSVFLECGHVRCFLEFRSSNLSFVLVNAFQRIRSMFSSARRFSHRHNARRFSQMLFLFGLSKFVLDLGELKVSSRFSLIVFLPSFRIINKFESSRINL